MLASDSGPPLRPEGLAKEEQLSLPTPTHLWMTSPTARLGQTPLSTPTRVSDRGCAEPLLTALLRLPQLEPIGTNRPGTAR